MEASHALFATLASLLRFVSLLRSQNYDRVTGRLVVRSTCKE